MQVRMQVRLTRIRLMRPRMRTRMFRLLSALYEKRLKGKALPLGRTSRIPVKEVGRSKDSKISEGQSRER